MHLVKQIAQVLYLFAPLLFSAGVSGLVMRFDWLPSMRRPIDGDCHVHGKRLFGANKTWRGVFVAVVGCVLGVAFQKYVIGAREQAIAVLDYSRVNVIAFGAAMGGGAMLGELPNSFVKRQLGIPAGDSARGFGRIVFTCWDQIDLLMGCWPLLLHFVRPDLALIAVSFAIALVLHPLFSWIGYVFGARRSAH